MPSVVFNAFARRSSPPVNRGLTGKSFVQLLKQWARANFSVTTPRKKFGTKFVLFGPRAVALLMNGWTMVVYSGLVPTIVIPELKYYTQRAFQSGKLRFAVFLIVQPMKLLTRSFRFC